MTLNILVFTKKKIRNCDRLKINSFGIDLSHRFTTYDPTLFSSIYKNSFMCISICKYITHITDDLKLCP